MDALIRRSGIGLAGLVGALLVGAAGALAQGDDPPRTPESASDTVTDDQVNAIAEQLYCPVCENIPLDVCGTQACADWRDEIRSMLERGQTEEEIKAHFVAYYGQSVLATPQAKGINLLVWVLPVAGVLVGAAALIVALRRMTPGALAAEPASAASYADLDAGYVARLEEELQEFAGQAK